MAPIGERELDETGRAKRQPATSRGSSSSRAIGRARGPADDGLNTPPRDRRPLAAKRRLPRLAGIGIETPARVVRDGSLSQSSQTVRGKAGEANHPYHQPGQPERTERGSRKADEPYTKRAASAVVDEH